MNMDLTTVTPIFEYAQNLLSSQQDDTLYSLREECALAKASLQNTIFIIESLSKNITPQNMSKALALSTTVRNALLEVSKITKLAVEVESLKASRLDIVQLLYIIKQVPELVKAMVFDEYFSLLVRVREDIILKLGYCPFEYLSDTCLLARLDVFVNSLTIKLQQLKVVHSAGCFDLPQQTAVPYNQIKEMLQSVP